jgi:hypothetical protein
VPCTLCLFKVFFPDLNLLIWFLGVRPLPLPSQN